MVFFVADTKVLGEPAASILQSSAPKKEAENSPEKLVLVCDNKRRSTITLSN